MTSKERVKMLLRRELPDRMGAFEHFWSETIPKFWVHQGYPSEETPVEEYFDYDIHTGGWVVDTVPKRGVEEIVEETDEWIVKKDGRGATLKTWKEKSGTPEHIGFEVTSRKKWEAYKQPLLELDRERIDFETFKKDLEYGKEHQKFTTCGNCFIFELMRATFGDVCFLENILLDPDWIRDFCQTYLDMYKRYYSVAFDEVGLPDGMWIYEDMGYTNGMFCSPKTFRELLLPYHKELVDFFHSYDLPVLLHTCGDIRKAIPLIVEAGFDCLQPMEAKAGCNVVEIASEFKDRISFMGNIDVTILNTNNRQNIKQEIEGKMNALKKMGASYIFHSDHSIPPDIRFETYEYALEVFRANAHY